MRQLWRTPESYSLYLWGEYYRRILATVREGSCFIADYDAYFLNAVEEIQRITGFTRPIPGGLPPQALAETIRPE